VCSSATFITLPVLLCLGAQRLGLVEFYRRHLLSFTVASTRYPQAEQPLLGGSHVNEDGLEREAVRAAARQHVSCHGGSCDDNKELAS